MKFISTLLLLINLATSSHLIKKKEPTHLTVNLGTIIAISKYKTFYKVSSSEAGQNFSDQNNEFIAAKPVDNEQILSYNSKDKVTVKVTTKSDETLESLRKLYENESNILALLNENNKIEGMPVINVETGNAQSTELDKKKSAGISKNIKSAAKSVYNSIKGNEKSKGLGEDPADFSKQMEKAAKSLYTRKLNSNEGPTVIFRYDCNLDQFIKKFQQNENFNNLKRKIQFKLAESVKLVHDSKLIHRQVILSNFFLKVKADKVTKCEEIQLEEMHEQDFTIAIGNFGTSIEDNNKHEEPVGKYSTGAPEIFYFAIKKNQNLFKFKNVYKKGYGQKVDVYSLAITLLQIEANNESFRVNNEKQFNKIREKVDEELGKLEEVEFKKLLTKMLELNPNERYGIKKVVKKLKGILKSEEKNIRKDKVKETSSPNLHNEEKASYNFFNQVGKRKEKKHEKTKEKTGEQGRPLLDEE